MQGRLRRGRRQGGPPERRLRPSPPPWLPPGRPMEAVAAQSRRCKAPCCAACYAWPLLAAQTPASTLFRCSQLCAHTLQVSRRACFDRHPAPRGAAGAGTSRTALCALSPRLRRSRGRRRSPDGWQPFGAPLAARGGASQGPWAPRARRPPPPAPLSAIPSLPWLQATSASQHVGQG